MRAIAQAQVGVFLRGRSVRALGDDDFTDITSIGFSETFSKVGQIVTVSDVAAPPDERVKRVVQALVTRIVRDANFRTNVYAAYDHRCAITGLRMLDSAGNSEVHAAHIFSVADGGPDVVQNGLALCGTVHWLFDHHLISLTDDHRLLVAADHVPAELQALMIRPGGKAYLPAKQSVHPHPKYLRKHRDRFTTLHGTK